MSSNNEIVSSLSHAIVGVIKEFKDIFLEMSGGLPPLTGIEHQIDFVTGAVLSNRPTYRTSPEETKELQRQVEELLAKDHI